MIGCRNDYQLLGRFCYWFKIHLIHHTLYVQRTEICGQKAEREEERRGKRKRKRRIFSVGHSGVGDTSGVPLLHCVGGRERERVSFILRAHFENCGTF